ENKMINRNLIVNELIISSVHINAQSLTNF
ncbi:MAG: hypothetical protein UV78_C0032G0001, partial [Parcubacteria group bacterium GW2011_GWA2_43_17]